MFFLFEPGCSNEKITHGLDGLVTDEPGNVSIAATWSVFGRLRSYDRQLS